MIKPSHTAASACLVVLAHLPAQQTWRISMAQLPATVAAAAPGDVVLVSGSATFLLPPLAITKPLSIHGSGASFVGGISIEGIASNQTFVLQGVEMHGSIEVHGCAGTVLLSQLTVPTAGLPTGSFVKIIDSLDVALESCDLTHIGTAGIPTVTSMNSSVTVSNCTVAGSVSGRGSPGYAWPALAAINSYLRVVHSALRGGSSTASTTVRAQPAVQLEASTLRMNGFGTAAIAGVDLVVPVSAVDGNGVLTLDPAVTLTPSRSAPAIGAGITVIQRAHPTTSMPPSSLGSIASVQTRGRAGDACAVLFGFPGLPQRVPGVLGELRIGASLTVAAITQLDGSGQFTLAFPVPNAPILRALTFRWQSITSDSVTTIWAEPATECHR
jgi:hypothetical protein